MTEEEWLACDDSEEMLRFLRGQASERKLRLFSCICLRRARRVLTPRKLRAVEISESYADGGIGEEELAIEQAAIDRLISRASYRDRMRPWATYVLPRQFAHKGLIHVLNSTFDPLWADYCASWMFVARPGAEAVKKKYHAQQTRCILLRDLFGNPFHPVSLSRTRLAWNEKTVVRLAQAAYDNRILPAGTLDNARLAVLADALEEAGCTDEPILTHLRSGGEHYRGCFVLDALLGKS